MENESGENERGENENENVLEWPIQRMQERMSDDSQLVYHGLTGEILQCILFLAENHFGQVLGAAMQCNAFCNALSLGNGNWVLLSVEHR